MKKKSRKTHSKSSCIFYCLALLLALAAIFLMFGEGIKQIDTEITYTGLQITFGYEYTTPITALRVKVLEFSFMNLLPYILLIIGLLFLILKALKVFKGNAICFIIALLFIAAGVLFFFVTSFIIPTGISNADLITEFRKSFAMSWGVIVSGVCSIIAGITMILPKFIK